ncbi:hypothetical protein G7Y79_00042g078240 [Physcia stellaris]|nr:hypothetical protein G7Y79_00042g078240 [Physcia stellaris]
MSSDKSDYVDIYHEFPDQPAPQDFVRRSNHASLAMGDYVYIDGGEIAMLVDGETTNMPIIDMSKSWSIDDVKFKSINKTSSGVLNLNDGFLFPAPDNQSFFQFGGESTWLLYTPRNPTSVSQFTITGGGNGSWSDFQPGSTSGFEHITRPSRALAATVDKTFFILGGLLNSHSAEDTANIQGLESHPLKGIVAWNMTTGRWTNDSMPSHLVRPNGLNGMLNSAPGFGLAGLLLAAGTGTVNDEAPIFDNITVYEPVGKTWHYQSATGDIPAGRNRPCTVGVQGDNGTYEIFMYAGEQNQGGGKLLYNQVQENVQLDAVYILSLPAFAWFRADYYAAHPRYMHTCHVVGNRQMLTIGGLNPLDAGKDTMEKDHQTNGLGLFDLTNLTWIDGYDADAAPYQTPQIIKDWYRENGTASVQWNDDAVRDFFRQSGSPKPGSTLPATNTSGVNKSTSPPIGAIAGGVVGGLAAICILATLLFWSLRRRRRNQHPGLHAQELPDSSEPPKFELLVPERRHEAGDGRPAWEMDGSQKMELDAGRYDKKPVELMGQEAVAEMPEKKWGWSRPPT